VYVPSGEQQTVQLREKSGSLKGREFYIILTL